MKRLKKLNYSLNYEIGDIIKDFDISKLIMSRNSLYKSYIDVSCNKKTQSMGQPLQVWINDNDEFILVDGYHRIIDLLFTNQRYYDIQIESIGYSDWVYPNDKFNIDFSLEWNGLEDFSDEETLESDYEDNYKE